MIADRKAACAANTPWNLVKCARGGGTNAASRAMKSKGSSTMCVEPSRWAVFKQYRTCPCPGRKMSTSYGNVIPLFASEKELRKLIMRIKTNSLEPGQPKDTAGIGWGEMKQFLFERINLELAPTRAEYERLIANPREVEQHLKRGAEKARAVSRPYLAEIRERVGIRSFAR